jgi:hypothetical protein
MRKEPFVLAAMLLVACGSDNPTAPTTPTSTPVPTPIPTPTPIPAPPGPPILLAPEANAVIPQDNPGPGCSYETGFRIDYDWADLTAPAGLAGYQIRVQRQGSPLAAVDATVTMSEYHEQRCGVYVIGQNLEGWVWSVRGYDRLGQFGPWVERPFSFAPCGQTYCR